MLTRGKVLSNLRRKFVKVIFSIDDLVLLLKKEECDASSSNPTWTVTKDGAIFLMT